MAEAVASESAKYMCRVGQHKLAMLRVGEFDEQPHAVSQCMTPYYLLLFLQLHVMFLCVTHKYVAD